MFLFYVLSASRNFGDVEAAAVKREFSREQDAGQWLRLM
jgi:hypothetical protein